MIRSVILPSCAPCNRATCRQAFPECLPQLTAWIHHNRTYRPRNALCTDVAGGARFDLRRWDFSSVLRYGSWSRQFLCLRQLGVERRLGSQAGFMLLSRWRPGGHYCSSATHRRYSPGSMVPSSVDSKHWRPGSALSHAYGHCKQNPMLGEHDSRSCPAQQ